MGSHQIIRDDEHDFVILHTQKMYDNFIPTQTHFFTNYIGIQNKIKSAPSLFIYS